MEMSRLTRDGTVEPVSRDQIFRRERGQRNIHFPVQLTTSRISNLTRLVHTHAICVTIHTHMVGRGFESHAERFSAIPRDPNTLGYRVRDRMTLWALQQMV